MVEPNNCPSCGCKKVSYLGEVILNQHFAGKHISPLLGGNNACFKCTGCGLHFKFPTIGKDQLLTLYQEGIDDNWQYELAHRKDWQIALDWIAKIPLKGSILDIGCWDGTFLELVGKGWTLNGIEVHPVAGLKAVSKGIKLIAKDVFELTELEPQFDVITCFDFIEHVEDPAYLLRMMSHLLKDNGVLILSSGNTESLGWKIAGHRYWYCAIPEHLSFVSKSWFASTAVKLNLKMEFSQKLSHAGEASVPTQLIDLFRILSYRLFPSVFVRLRRMKYGVTIKQEHLCYPPACKGTKDHLLVVLKKMARAGEAKDQQQG